MAHYGYRDRFTGELVSEETYNRSISHLPEGEEGRYTRELIPDPGESEIVRDLWDYDPLEEWDYEDLEEYDFTGSVDYRGEE